MPSFSARLTCFWVGLCLVLPCPFSEGKTASGQVEKNQLYHRIWMVPEGFEPQEWPSDFWRHIEPLKQYSAASA